MPRWFSVMLVPKLSLTPIKIRNFWPKNGQIWSKICIFGHFGPNIAIFYTFCPMLDQKPMWTRCPVGFFLMWVTKLLISPVKKRFFCPKTTKFGPKLAFLVNLGQAMQAYSLPCCGSVGGFGARAVFCKTPIFFMPSPGDIRKRQNWALNASQRQCSKCQWNAILMVYLKSYILLNKNYSNLRLGLPYINLCNTKLDVSL